MMMQRDVAFVAETIPPNLQKLIEGLRDAFHVPAENIGAKGDLDHRRGYHRSRRFLLRSPFSVSQYYSVIEPGNLKGDEDWICAIDISLPEPQLIATCKRLDQAVRAGKLEKVAEWYGNTNGDNHVDGFDNIANAIASSDPSHLWHLHISLIRGRANEDHSDLLAILTGKDDDMEPDTPVPVPKKVPFSNTDYLKGMSAMPAGELWHGIYYHVNGIENALKALNTTLSKLTGVVTTMSAATHLEPAMSEVIETQGVVTEILNDLAARLKAAASTVGK